MKNMKKLFASMTALVMMSTMTSVTVWADNENIKTERSANDQLDLSLVFESKAQLDVYVNDTWSARLSDTYSCGETVSLTAPAVSGKVFSHWEADGSIISYNNPLKMSLNANTMLHAVYANSAPTAKAVSGFTSITRSNEGDQIVFQAISGEKTFDSAGIVYSTTVSGSNLKVETSGVTKIEAEKISDKTTTLPTCILDDNNCWTFRFNPTSDTTLYYVRTYVTSGSTTTYGDIKKVQLSKLNSGISLIADPDGFNPGNENKKQSLSDLLKDVQMYTVTFDANGGTGTMTSQAVLSTTATKLNTNTFTRSGYTFNGWNTKANGSGTSYSDGASVNLSADTTLYAQWKSQYVAPVVTKSYQTFTVHMDSYIYDGTAHGVTINGTTVGKVIYYYYNADTDELLDGAPSEVGNYRVRVYAGGSSSYNSRNQSVEYAITNPIDKNGMANVGEFKTNNAIPTVKGKIFAGYFTDSTCTTPYTKDSGKAYAKFIDEKILTVKAQISSKTTADSASTSIRFITSVDSLKYQNVGFKITYNGKTIDKQTATVYTVLLANGKKVYPSVFSADSHYMEAYTLNNIPQSAFSKEFTVTPYYTTQDGTIVEGATNTFTIANMIS